MRLAAPVTSAQTRWRRIDPAWGAHVVVVVAGLAVGWWVALTYQPLPVSDFAHYWVMASDPTAYAKGGAWIVALTPLKALGLSPHVAAALVHTGAWLGLAWVLWDPHRAGSRPIQALATLVLACLGAWFCTLWGIVAGDVVHVAATAVGATLLMRTWRDRAGSIRRRHWRVAGAVVVLGLGLSIRMQSMPVACLVAAVGCAIGGLTDRRAARWFALAAGAAIVLAIMVEVGMRARSTQPLRLYTRITIYSGMLATDPGPRCGTWSEQATAMTREDLDQPFLPVLRRRLADKWPEVPSILACKLRTYVAYTRIGVAWLRASVPPEARLHLPAIRALGRTEHHGGQALKVLLVVMFMLGLSRSRGRPGRGLAITVPLLVVSGYVFQHAVVEIQARYVIEPVVFGLTASWLGFGWRQDAGGNER